MCNTCDIKAIKERLDEITPQVEALCESCNGDGEIGMYRDGQPIVCDTCNGKGRHLNGIQND